MEMNKRGLYIQGEVGTTKVTFLVDTGASETFVSRKLYEDIPVQERSQLQPMKVDVRQADGSPLPVLGKIHTQVQVGKASTRMDVIVADIANDGILGMDFLLKVGCILNLNSLEIQLDNQQIKALHEGEAQLRRVVISDTVTVPPRHEIVVRGKIIDRESLDKDGSGVLEPIEESTISGKGLMVARIIVDTSTDNIPIRIRNPGNDVVKINKDTVAATITNIPKDEIVSYHESTYVRNMSVMAEGEKELPEHVSDLFERGSSLLCEKEKEALKEMLMEFQDVFSKGDFDIGKTNLVKHTINTGDAAPIRQRYRRLPKSQQEEADTQIKDLLERGVIEPSSSPWASPIVLVKKKDGTTRFCIDYRKLNSVTVKDAFPLPRIDDTLDALAGAKWFSTMDLASGYWQVELENTAKEKSAFAVRSGLYQWKVMPFGLCNAPVLLSG